MTERTDKDAKHFTGRPRLNAVLYAMLLEELVAGPTTLHALCEVTGFERKTVRSILKAMHDRKLVHLSGYDKDSRGRAIVPVWTFGRGRDAKRQPKSHAENCRSFRERERKGELSAAFSMAANDSARRAA